MSKMYRIVRESVVRQYIRAESVRIQCPSDVAEYAMRQGMCDLQVEEFRVLLLDSQHRMFADVLVSRGILNQTIVHPREVFAPAIHKRAAAMVLIHNHPSGDPNPSEDDVTLTKRLVEAGRLLDMPIYDHIVIGAYGHISLAECGLM